VKSARVDVWQLRKVFNEAQMWERCLANELTEQRTRTGTPRADYNQPDGTLSVASYLVDRDGRRVALVHYYLLPNGRINNNKNMPDPKWCIVGDTRYSLPPPRRR